MTSEERRDVQNFPSRDPHADLTLGSHVGPYIVLERLGRGGMGQVFLADDSRLHRKVALKCLLPADTAGDLRSQILHEARAVSRINHPHVAAVYDVIEHATRAFMVMEYVEGESLARRLEHERIPIVTAIGIARQVASALAAAHANGIVHRDLKPANIQVARDGSVKILDFGAARAYAVASTATTETITNADVQGTFGYMAPEQMLGGEPEPRSDLFSLGVVLHEMATGRRPAVRADPFAVCATTARPLQRTDEVEPRIPLGLSDIIAMALALDPDKRIQTAAEFEALLAELDQTGERATSSIRKRPPPAESVSSPIPSVPDLRGRLILARSASELRRLKYEVDHYLAMHPHDVEGRILIDDIDRALAAVLPPVAATRTPLPPSTHSWTRRLRYASAIGFVLIVVAGSFGIFRSWLHVDDKPEGRPPAVGSPAAADRGTQGPPPVPAPVAPNGTPRFGPPSRSVDASRPEPEPTSPAVGSTPAPIPARPSADAAQYVDEDQTAIRKVVALYGRAIENKNLALFRSVKPNLSRDEERRLDAGFRAVISQRVSLTILSIERRDDRATVVLRRRDTIELSQVQQTVESQQMLTMQRTRGGWVIIEIR